MDRPREMDSHWAGLVLRAGYNIFVFGSYVEGQSDIDIAVYTENFDLYKRLSVYLEQYFAEKGIESDIFYIDLTMQAPVPPNPSPLRRPDSTILH